MSNIQEGKKRKLPLQIAKWRKKLHFLCSMRNRKIESFFSVCVCVFYYCVSTSCGLLLLMLSLSVFAVYLITSSNASQGLKKKARELFSSLTFSFFFDLCFLFFFFWHLRPVRMTSYWWAGALFLFVCTFAYSQLKTREAWENSHVRVKKTGKRLR